MTAQGTYRRWHVWLRAVGWLVPAEHRDAWLAEWRGELWDAVSREGSSRERLARRMLGAFPHALWLLRSEWRIWIMTQDIRYAVRTMTRGPGFAFLVVGTLALGIGASTAMFTLVRSVLLRPLPFPEPESLVYAYGSFSQNDFASISPPDYLDYRERNHSFASFAARTFPGSAVLTGGGGAERVSTIRVTANFFATLDVSPQLGRSFLPEEEVGDGHYVVMLSHTLWQRRFGGARDVVGRTLELDGTQHEIVGVVPAVMDRMFEGDLWQPIAFHTSGTSVRRFHFLRGVGRLSPGVTLAQAQADIDAIARQLEAVYPENETWTLRLLPYRDALVGDAGRALLILLGAVTLVLLIACGNVASLLLARATTRSGEVAVRAAMGASRSRLVRQLLTESMILGLAGGAAGFLLALLLVRGARLLAAGFLPSFAEVVVDPVVLLFTVGISIGTGLLFGLAPALHFARPGAATTLQSIGRSSGTRVSLRARDVLVVAQIAISLSLLVGAGLLARTLLQLQNVDPGFDSGGVMIAEMRVSGERYPTREAQTRFWTEVIERTRAVPGVIDATATTLVPLVGGNDTYYWIEGQPPTSDAERRNAEISVVADRYFETMGIPLVRGRTFRAREASGPNAIILNEALATRLFPDSDAIGKRLVVDFGEPFTAEIVGIAGDVLAWGLDGGPTDMMYFPYDQLGGFGIGFMNLVVRAGEDPLAVLPAMRTALGEIDANNPLSNPREMSQVVGGTLATQRFGARLLLIFAAVALALAVIGLYGVLGYVVAQRTREMGVRVALGAGRTQIFTIVLRRGMTMVAIGLVLGTAAAFATSHLLRGLLFAVSARDPMAFAIGPAVLLLAGFLACALPARRATRVDPVHALKGQ